MRDKSRDALLDTLLKHVPNMMQDGRATIRDLLDEHGFVLAREGRGAQWTVHEIEELKASVRADQRARYAAKVRERIRKTGGDCHWNRMLEQIATAIEEDGQ